MKKLILLFVLLPYAIQSYSQCGGLVAGSNTTARTMTGNCTINGDVTITKDLNIPPGTSLTINGNFSSSKNVIIDGGSFTVNGNFDNTAGDVDVINNANLTVTGYFNNASNANVNFTSGTVVIGGDFINDGNGNISSNGTVSIGGDFTVTGNSTLSISGGLSIDGAATFSGGADIVINSGGVLEANTLTATGGTSTVTIGSGGTLYTPGGAPNVTNLNNNAANGDQVCTNGCCGAQCNAAGTGLNSTAQQTLPVTLLTFDAQRVNNSIELTWSTATEINTSHFEIYKSVNGADFYYLSDIQAAGNSKTKKTYTFYDEEPASGNNQYQLVSVDFDGYKEVFSAKFSEFHNAYLSVYPNPSDGYELTIVKPDHMTTSEVIIYNLNGKIVFQETLEIGQSKIQFSNRLPLGIYLLNLKDGNQIITQKISIQ